MLFRKYFASISGHSALHFQVVLILCNATLVLSRVAGLGVRSLGFITYQLLTWRSCFNPWEAQFIHNGENGALASRVIVKINKGMYQKVLRIRVDTSQVTHQHWFPFFRDRVITSVSTVFLSEASVHCFAHRVSLVRNVDSLSLGGGGAQASWAGFRALWRSGEFWRGPRLRVLATDGLKEILRSELGNQVRQHLWNRKI